MVEIRGHTTARRTREDIDPMLLLPFVPGSLLPHDTAT